MITQTLEQRARLDIAALQQLEASLSTYAELSLNAALLAEQLDAEKVKIGQILEDAGIEKDATEDFSLCWVRDAQTSTLDKTKLLAMGVTTAMLEQATITKPKRPYFQIRAKKKLTGSDAADNRE